MISVSVAVAQTQLSELARRAENGETVVVTRDGRPVFDLSPHRRRAGLRLGAIGEFKRRHGLEAIFTSVAEDFDDPLPEDLFLRPLPPDA
jgi:antitoxin (DNA-binding transcriptional repressor) of toxin-antitoxin stability system